MPVSSATSRAAVSTSVSPASTWPLGRHHSTRPARLRRAMTAMSATTLADVDDDAPGRALLDGGQTPPRQGLGTGSALASPPSPAVAGTVVDAAGDRWPRVTAHATRAWESPDAH